MTIFYYWNITITMMLMWEKKNITTRKTNWWYEKNIKFCEKIDDCGDNDGKNK